MGLLKKKDKNKIDNEIQKLVDEKKFNEIYIKYGSDIYNEYVPKKERAKDAKKLAEEEKYEEIYKKHGSYGYSKYVPKKVRVKDAKKLFEEGKWEEIYIKHGADVYRKYLPKMREIDVIAETGSKPKGMIERAKMFLKVKFAPFLLSTLIMPAPTATFTLKPAYDMAKGIVYLELNEDINKYNTHIKQYAEEIRAMNLSDLQTFVKLIYDLHKITNGGHEVDDGKYEPFWRLAIYNLQGGVCRNFADDMTAKLKELGYNARNIYCYIGSIEDSSTENKIMNISKKYMGNHMVTCVYIDNIALIIDPLNYAIGILENGNIEYLASMYNMDGVINRPMTYHQFIREDIAYTVSYVDHLIDSYKEISSKEKAKIIEKYGQEAFNKAIYDIYQMDIKKDVSNANTANIESRNDKKEVVPKVETGGFENRKPNNEDVQKPNNEESER